MLRPNDLGEVTITLAKVALPLRFKSLNWRAYTQISGESPYDIIDRFQAIDQERPETAGKLVTDIDLLINLIVAGLAHHKEYRQLPTDQALEKVGTLLDMHADQSGKSLFSVVTELFTEILPVMCAGIVGPSIEEQGDQGNDQAEAVKSGEVSSVGDN